MVSSVRRFSGVIPVILAGLLVLSGCATKKYVRTQVATLEPSIKENQTKTAENAERIDAVDRRAQQGITDARSAAAAADKNAQTANQAAQQANQAAQGAQQTANTANQGVQQANNRIQ